VSSEPTLIVFLGGIGGSPVEDLLASALRHAALDLLEEALATNAFGKAIIASDDASLANELPPGAELDLDNTPFHFGERLASLIRERQIIRPLYIGAGAVPLMRASDIAAVAERMRESDGVVVSNNYFSADLVGWTPGHAIERIDLPVSDNFLPRLLHDQAGLQSEPLPRASATQFNIDSPSDLAILKAAGKAGPRLDQFIQTLNMDVDRYCRVMRCLVDPKAELLLAGRVGSQVWSYLERETACRIRLFSEERGMQAAGRHESGEARSMLAYHLASVGCRTFFEELSEMSDAACIDTRPLLVHLKTEASRADRFRSDLGDAHAIDDAFLREFTKAAEQAAIPVVLGGHSLVAGGLMLLTEAAWREEDARLLAER
jgi:hypothetical protein